MCWCVSVCVYGLVINISKDGIVDIVHVSFIKIILLQFLVDGLYSFLFFKLGHICVRLGTLDTRVKDDCWNIWVGDGFRCLGHDVWLTYITIGCPKISINILHFTGKLVQGYWSNIKDITLYVTAPTLEVGLFSSSGPWVLVRVLLHMYLFFFMLFPCFLQSINLTHSLQGNRMF